MIAAIVAVDNNFGIGYQNNLLTHIPEDLKNFKSLTSTGAVVMGRKTYDSLPRRPLPNRLNIVITNQNIQSLDENVIYMNLKAVKKWLAKIEINVFIIGGSSIYEQLLPYCEKIYLTKIYKTYKDVDSFFPNIDKDFSWRGQPISSIREYQKVLYQFWLYNRL